ncbi:MAG: tetratricopeptide repeat protein [Acidobacteriota bacterium]
MTTLRLSILVFGAILWAVLNGPVEAQPDDLDRWIEAESRHFAVLSNAEPAIATETVVRLEAFRTLFSRLADGFDLRSPAPTVLVAFRDGESFSPYKTRADGEGTRILGQFGARPEANILTLDVGAHAAGAWPVVLHEYTHHLVTHNIPGAPLWLNEGLAEYYSTFEMDNDGRARVGQPVERHLQWLGRDPELDLAGVLAADSGEARVHGPREVGRFYAVSWLLAHYLLSSGPERLDQLAGFLILVALGDDPEDALNEAFDLDVGELEEVLRAYLAGTLPSATIDLGGPATADVRLRPVEPADVLTRLGELALLVGAQERAGRHFDLALAIEPEHAEAAIGQATRWAIAGRLDEADVAWQDAVARGLDRPLPLLLAGRHALRRGRLEDAKPLLEQAAEAYPGYAEAWHLLGLAHLARRDGSAARRAALEAREAAPDRPQPVLLEIRALLALEEIAAARRLVEGELRRLTSEEVADRAREEVERHRWLLAARRAFAQRAYEEAITAFDRAVDVTSDPTQRQRLEAELVRWVEQVERAAAAAP